MSARRTATTSIFLLLGVAGLLSATSGFEFRHGSLWMGNAYRSPWTETTVEGSEASPLLTLTGASYTFVLTPDLQLSPGIDLWYRDFAFTEDRAVPTQIETAPGDDREVAGTLGVFLSVPIEYTYPVSERWFIRTGFSPTTLYRIPVAPVEASPTDNLTRFFFERGRFLFPEIRFGFGYHMEERVTFQFSGRWMMPLWRLWDGGPDLPWWDSHMVSGQLGVRIRRPAPDQQ